MLPSDYITKLKQRSVLVEDVEAWVKETYSKPVKDFMSHRKDLIELNKLIKSLKQ